MDFITVNNGEQDFYIRKEYIYCIERHPESLKLVIRLEPFNSDVDRLVIKFKNVSDLDSEYMMLKRMLYVPFKNNSFMDDKDSWSE